jgi:hypothetical protein
MANIKITDLTAYGDPTSTDVLPIVDVGADATKKVSIADLLENAGSGTAGAPGIAFDGDPDTGIYRPGEDQLAISTNGVQRINFEADGDINIDSGGVFYDATNNRLGVGITVPQQVFHAHASTDTRLKLTDDTTGNGAFDGFEVTSQGSLVQREATGIKFFVNDGSSTDERARLDGSGRMLVGLSTLASGGDASAETARFVVQGRVGNDNDSGRMNIQRGSVPPSAGVDIGNIFFTDSSNNVYAGIAVECDGTTGAGDHPGRLAFSVTADGASSPTEALSIKNTRVINFSNAPVYADNAAAKTGGLVDGDVYRTSTGDLKIVYT